MAKNYTATKFKVRNKKGSSSFLNNLNKTSGTMRITPNGGYVVSASDFSISNIPTALSSVAFSDSTTAGTIGNKVLVTAVFSDTFVANKNTKISLKLIGSAKKWKPEVTNISIGTTIIDDRNKSSNGTAIITAADNYTTETTSDIGTNGRYDIITNKITGNSTKNKLTKVGELVVSANTDYKFLSEPYLKHGGIDASIKLKKTKTTKDSNKNIISYTFDIMYKDSLNVSSNNIVYIIYNAKVIPTINKEIRSVTFGSNEVSDLGETREIIVNGISDAAFSLTITKDSDGTSIISDEVSNFETITPSGTLKSIAYAFNGDRPGIQSASFLQKFPAPTVLSTTLSSGMSDTTTMNIASKEDLAVGDKINMGQIKGGKIIKIVSIHGSHSQVTTSENITAPSGAPVTFVRKEKYYINLYPREGTTLGPNIPTIEPRYTITQNVRPVLTLKCTSTHAAANPADIIFAGKANAKGTELRNIRGASGSTATITNRKNYFKISYSFTASSGNWTDSGKTVPTWSSTDSSSSSWTNSVHGDTVPAHGGVIVAGNGGTHIEISNIKVGGMASNTATLTANVLVKKWGTDDVTMTLDIDSAFIDGA
jgi:hypothetical protein